MQAQAMNHSLREGGDSGRSSKRTRTSNAPACPPGCDSVQWLMYPGKHTHTNRHRMGRNAQAGSNAIAQPFTSQCHGIP